jgi:hypothetical protein
MFTFTLLLMILGAVLPLSALMSPYLERPQWC